MKKKGCKLVAGVLFLSALTCFAAKREDVDLYQWSIRGTRVTATAAQLNTAGSVAAYPLVTNVSVAITPAVMTNGTVAIAGGSAVVTGVTASGTVTPAVMTNGTVAVSVVGGGAVGTNITTTTLAVATNGTIAVTVIPILETNTLVCLDGSSNVITNTIVYVASATATAVFTPQTDNVLASAALETGAVTATAVLTPQTVASAAVAVTVTPTTGAITAALTPQTVTPTATPTIQRIP